MTTLIQRMREELVRRNYAATTIQSYLKAMEHFWEYINAPLDQLGPDDIRSYHAHLLEDRKLAVNTVVVNVSEEEIRVGLRYIYGRAKLACEAGAAVGVAALLAGKISDLGIGPVVAVVSGGNITPQAAAAILHAD